MAKKQKISVVDGSIVCEYPTIGKKFTANLAKYPRIIQTCALEHGFKQKFGDAKSGESPAEKYAEVLLIHASLMNGEWERTATVDLTPRILEAVCTIKGFKFHESTLEITAKKPDGKTVTWKPDEATVKTWASDAKVKAKILEIRAAKAKKAAEESTDEIEVAIPE